MRRGNNGANRGAGGVGGGRSWGSQHGMAATGWSQNRAPRRPAGRSRHRTGATERRWDNRPSRYQDFKRPLRLLARPRRPVSTSTWLPDSSSSAQRGHRRPIYVSFVSKAILWDRGLRHNTAHVYSNICPPLCPRFLSHMKARPEDFRPPCFLSSTLRPQPPSQAKTRDTHVLAAPKTQTLDGRFSFSTQRRQRAAQNGGVFAGRRSDAVVPCLPLPATPPPSTANPTPPHLCDLYQDSGRQQSEFGSAAAPLLDSPRSPNAKNEFQKQERAPQPAVVSITESTELHWRLNLRPAGPQRSESAASAASSGSLSDLSRPPSSRFSRSTDLASGRSSVLSADATDSTSDVRISLHPSPVMELPPPPLPAGSSPHQSSTKTTTPPHCELVFGQTKAFSPRVGSHSEKPASSSQSRKSTANPHKAAAVDPGLNPSSDSDQGLVTLTFPSTTWSSCPSPQMTTPRSAPGAQLTPSPPVSCLDSHRWPVLPPISPVRGRSGTAASRYSELSESPSRVFDELEAIAPRSTSCLSLDDEASDSSASSPPDTDLSPAMAALTVGCDSGNLGSLSRVQLLLLDRAEPETLQSPCSLEEDWSDLNWSSAGVSRPLTAGSIFERSDSTGKVRDNKSDQSEGGSWSPSSWIIDPTPSDTMFRSSRSPRPSSHGSSADGEGHIKDESSCSGWRDHGEFADTGSRPGTVDQKTEEDIWMEERKTKAMHVLSKLQDETRRKCNSNKGCSNFEDFDFLAKYCIFSQETLAEYKQAFEAEDGDGDGYISCLQVLLALKSIIPPELLTDEEEIYVYRILEMVDFRVTDGLVDLRLFAVIASLAQKIATMDEFMRSLICNMDFRSLEVRLFKAKQLFLFLLEEQRGEAGPQRGFISAEQLLLELKAGGIRLEQEAAIRLELQHIPPLDLLDFLAYLPLFMLIHKSVISNPLNDSSNLADL